jgi:predicted nicotinamide N-methyase
MPPKKQKESRKCAGDRPRGGEKLRSDKVDIEGDQDSCESDAEGGHGGQKIGGGSASDGDFNHFNSNEKDNVYSIDIFGHSLDFLQSPEVSRLGIGGCVWDSSIIFTKYIEHLSGSEFSSTLLNGKTVLELGSGCGLAGMAFLIKGSKVSFTDIPVVVEEITEPNVTKNFRRIVTSGRTLNTIYDPSVFPLDWKNLESSCIYHTEVDKRKLFDYIILTDCVFSEEIVHFLIRAIETFSHKNTSIYCVFEDRDENITKVFLAEMKSKYTIKFVNYSDMDPKFRSKTVKLFHAKAKRSVKTSLLSTLESDSVTTSKEVVKSNEDRECD